MFLELDDQYIYFFENISTIMNILIHKNIVQNLNKN